LPRETEADVIDWIGVMMAMFAVGTVVAVYVTGM
jgi:hypothetical protein